MTGRAASLRQAAAEDECWRGLIVIDGLVEQCGGGFGLADDDAGDGTTVYVSIRLPGGQ
jgi:hypothetical protein